MDEVRQTWSRIGLRRTLDHGVAGQAGQNHGRHDFIHLHRLWAAETGEKHWRNAVKTLIETHCLVLSQDRGSPVRSVSGGWRVAEVHGRSQRLEGSSQGAPAQLGLGLQPLE